MRKILKYLIPIIGSVSITTPFLVSCGKQITINIYKSWQTIATTNPRLEEYLISQKFEIKKDQTWKAICDLRDYSGSDFHFIGMCFATEITDQKPILISGNHPKIIDVTVDGTKLVFDDLSKPTYYWVSAANPFNNDMFSELDFHNIDVTQSSFIEINFTLPIDYDNFYFMCNCGFRLLD